MLSRWQKLKNSKKGMLYLAANAFKEFLSDLSSVSGILMQTGLKVALIMHKLSFSFLLTFS